VVFTAHSLPASILEAGEPYDDQVRETARLVAEQSGLAPDRWQFCYQSAGASSVRWLGPRIEDVVLDLARSGQAEILVAPVGFVSDHVEILFDLGVEAKGLAAEHGAHLERTESLNVSPLFVEALADIVRSRAVWQ
jgi:ferrochelatase